MKILYFITKSNWGGAQKYVYDCAIAAARTNDVSVALGGEGARDAIHGLLKKRLDAAHVRVIFIRSFMRDISLIRELASLWEVYRVIRREDPDIVHLNSSKAGGVGALAARLTGVKKIVFTAHGWAFNEPRPFPIRASIWFFSWLTALLATDIIVLAHSEFQAGKHMPFVGKKLRLIPIGIKEENTLSRSEARASLHISPDTFLVGTIAELHPNKGLPFLLKAISLLSHQLPTAKFQLLLLGEGQERTQLETLAKKLTIHDRVRMPGFIPHAASYLSAFDIFVLPSIKEGLPYTILEAGLRGVPVVATDVGGVRDIIPNKQYGTLVPPKNAGALSDALEKLISSPDLRVSCGRSLKQRTVSLFSKARMIQDTLDLYQS